MGDTRIWRKGLHEARQAGLELLCTRCGQTKPAVEMYQPTFCNTCRAASRKGEPGYEAGKARAREYAKQRRATDPAIKARDLERTRARRADPEKWAKESARLKARYKERFEDPEFRAQGAARLQHWRKRNPDKHLAQARRGIAKRAQAEQRQVTVRDIHRMRVRQRGECFYCGEPKLLQLEHVIPLARGGRHAIGNLVLACRECNSSKRTRLLVEWKRYQRQRGV
jgi:5-methylcytosine-specific restriction endonuclease McrA